MATNKDITLSPREMEVLALAWQCMESQPKIDMTKLASLTGYTTGSASVTFGNIKRKIKLLGESLSSNGPATPKKTGGPGRSKATPASTSTSGRKKKRGAADNGAADTPSKKKKKAAHDYDGDDVDEEFVVPKVKKEEVQDLALEGQFWGQVEDFAQVGVGGFGGTFGELE
ncbi:hypothetical protein P153DRAFT_184310 [Dothidotthia symphoricarpi CBS 119687]|uniref:Uncharacterized protein n=1 Tax=Dothidotthia symphoricarpi CBS 119687 TaxID=1392245 RepID=A0A6A6AKL5_9PLEO|nr:uncharacterized protein P153DRAFT_184310 [Dothidotthia symphoricarpi CBS 119687]KAF2132106.1 hypothetical protein P153DRAFT_184310 [Dothidotthia symphoricarpi CBS 119687]